MEIRINRIISKDDFEPLCGNNIKVLQGEVTEAGVRIVRLEKDCCTVDFFSSLHHGSTVAKIRLNSIDTEMLSSVIAAVQSAGGELILDEEEKDRIARHLNPEGELETGKAYF